jgi:glycosyltransferase involved in cell wall biosynthesis
MPTFSLIIATLGRTAELETLFSSLASQAYPGLECIVVDQNTDDRLEKIVDGWRSRLPLRRITSSPGLSRARNAGLKIATGDIIAFPDDDCWYSDSLLANVSAWFASHSDFDVLTVGARDRDGAPSGNRWIQDQCEIRPGNAFRTTFSSTIFVRRTSITQDKFFDESLGVGAGTPFACGEETDYVLNLLRAGARGYFDRKWHIGHPKRDMLSGEIDGRRAAGYGRGMGRVLQKHSEPLLLAGFVAYDLVRSASAAIKGDVASASLCVLHAWGISNGYASDSVFPLASTATSRNLHPARLLAYNNRPFAAPNRRLSS